MSLYLFNLYAEFIIQKTGLDMEQGGLTTGGRSINNLCADDTTLLAGSSNDST